MGARVARRRFLEVDAALVDALVRVAHRIEDQTHLVAGGAQVRPAVQHRRVGPVLGVLHVLAPRVHTSQQQQYV